MYEDAEEYVMMGEAGNLEIAMADCANFNCRRLSVKIVLDNIPQALDFRAGISVVKASPDILFVAFGIPRQEKWIDRYKDALGVPVCMGVGGSFDVISGRLKRAPAWMQRCGLEWVYRVAREPKRIGRILSIPQFLLLALWARHTDVQLKEKRK
jgi:hypothetical protein